MRFIYGSLRLKIVLVFSGFSILLGIALFAGVLLATKHSEEYSLKKRLELETGRYLKSLVTSPVAPVAFSAEIPVPKSPYMTSYMYEELLPEWAAKSLAGLPEGDYERTNDKQSYYISIRDLQDGRRFYLLYNVTTLLTDRMSLALSRRYLAVSLLPTFIIGLLLGVITSYKAVSPVVRLTKMVKQKEETGVLPADIKNGFENDEVGYLAGTLEHAITGMQQSIDREKAFARDASHELRTPVTVLNGAIKILSGYVDDDDMEKKNVISRMQRAIFNMEHLINSFLWLSKHEYHETKGAVRVSQVIRDCIDSNSYLIRNKDLKVEVEEHLPAVFPVVPEVLTIVAGNLIRNAIAYTHEGKVTVSIYGKCLSVEDTGPGIPRHVLDSLDTVGGVAKTDGFGFGLSIAHRMCTQLGWKLKIKSKEGEGTKISLCCSTEENADVECACICDESSLSA